MNEAFWIVVILLSSGFQIGAWYLIFNKLNSKSSPEKEGNFKPVSLLICARNAKFHLEQNLETILDQAYPVFELILVDDDSEDGTEDWLKNLLLKYPQLKYYRNQKTADGKKQALSLGISKSSYDWIALTDADCKPDSPFWLKTMMTNAGEATKIVLGYAPYSKEQGWLNKLIRFETCMNAIQSLSAAKSGFPYMGTGRNLIYEKFIFDKNAIKPDLAYGDDDLLIHAKATKRNTAVCLEPDSFVYSVPARNYKDYFNQKWRHYAASHEYGVGIKLYLFVYFASIIGFYFSFVILLLYNLYTIAFSCLLIKYLFIWPLFCKQCRLFKEQDLCKYYPVLNLLYVFHLILQFPFLWIKKKSW